MHFHESIVIKLLKLDQFRTIAIFLCIGTSQRIVLNQNAGHLGYRPKLCSHNLVYEMAEFTTIFLFFLLSAQN
jgi:hypothetical protein